MFHVEHFYVYILLSITYTLSQRFLCPFSLPPILEGLGYKIGQAAAYSQARNHASPQQINSIGEVVRILHSFSSENLVTADLGGCSKSTVQSKLLATRRQMGFQSSKLPCEKGTGRDFVWPRCAPRGVVKFRLNARTERGGRETRRTTFVKFLSRGTNAGMRVCTCQALTKGRNYDFPPTRGWASRGNG
jgi:hypothetical protein